MELGIAILSILIVALIIFMVVEYREYRRYVNASKALIAFGEGMRVAYTDVITEVNKIGFQQNIIAESMLLTDNEVAFIKARLALHAEALGLKSLTDLEAASHGKESQGTL